MKLRAYGGPAKVSTSHFSNFSSFSRGTPANPKFAEDPIWWRDLFEERAAIRQNDGGYTRAEAERLAWDELEGHGITRRGYVPAACVRSTVPRPWIWTMVVGRISPVWPDTVSGGVKPRR